jgi:hypothetical protein
MTSNQHRWLRYGLAGVAIICSLVSLFALTGMGAPTWTTALNTLSLAFVLLAVKTRGPGSSDGG